MAKARLVINNEKEVAVGDGVTSIGRTADNMISLSDDSNVSRYHAEIETRGGEFWLIELGSSNGTTVNGQRVSSERLLRDGDVILLGGTSEIVFEFEKSEAENSAKESPASEANAPEIPATNVQTPSVLPAAAASEAAIEADTEKASKLPLLLAVAGVVCGLAVVFVVAAIAISFSLNSKCEAKAVITSPESGDTISKETEIEIEADNTDCTKRAIFLLNGEEFASASESPYTVSLDPKQFPELSDGTNHSLKVAFEDAEGNKIVQPGEVLLVFESLATPTPTPEAVEDAPVKPPTQKDQQNNKKASLIEVQEMSKNLLKEFSGNSNYKFDQQFLQEVQKKTAEYAVDGYFARAQAFRDTINVEFHKENGLDPPLGHILAMSRSQFKPQKQGANEGLWQLTDAFVTGNNYKASCPTESLSDATQNCAAKTAAIYSKALFVKIFSGDVVYAVSAFGMSEGEASQWQGSLPADRADFWKNIKSQPQRDLVVRFFAAGIVAENPQKFGLKNDRPISEFYRNLMGK